MKLKEPLNYYEAKFRVFPERDLKKLYEEVTDRFFQIIKNNPKSVIILPTGSTPLKMYQQIVSRYREDQTLDLSQAYSHLFIIYSTFFNLDEYAFHDTKAHPLSYFRYMQHYFYLPLRQIDPNRAPKRGFVPEIDMTDLEASVFNYRRKLERAIEDSPSGRVELAVLGIGGAYPSSGTLFGGHIGFNEPGTRKSQQTHIVKLTEKTRKDTKHRFQSLQRQNLYDKDTSVPHYAITLGIAEILKSKEIFLLASGEDKGPVIKEIFSKKHTNSKFPGSYLLHHPNCTWFLDSIAGKSLSIPPWSPDMYCGDSARAQRWFFHSIVRLLHKHDIDDGTEFVQLEEKDFKTIPMELSTFKSVDPSFDEKAFADQKPLHQADSILREFQRQLMKACLESNLPKNKNVLIMSPHPDDDVISMGATLKQLIARGNTITICYAVSGSNSVRPDFSSCVTHYDRLAERNLVTHEARLELAQTFTREDEARNATEMLGFDTNPKNRLIFMRCEYYTRRGIPGLPPITSSDQQAMEKILLSAKGSFQYIFFAAENDPHGAHGLSTSLLARGLKKLRQDQLDQKEEYELPVICGYRGAYNEWDIDEPENLIGVAFSESIRKSKESAIKAHKSQLNPLFPSFDSREFYERARDRNRISAAHINRIHRSFVIGKPEFVFFFPYHNSQCQ